MNDSCRPLTHLHKRSAGQTPRQYVPIILSAFHNAGSNAYMGQVSYHRVHMFYASSDKFGILSVKEAFFRILSRYISLRLQYFHNACIPLIPSLLWDHTRTRTDQIIQLDHVFPFRSPHSIQRIAFHSLNQRFKHLSANKRLQSVLYPLLSLHPYFSRFLHFLQNTSPSRTFSPQ